MVPLHFVSRGHSLYSFSMMGQKEEWMRENPLVCFEVDDVRSFDDWTSVVVFGSYSELPERSDDARYAIELFQARPMWWEPGTARIPRSDNDRPSRPVFFRILMDRVTGRVAIPDALAGAL